MSACIYLIVSTSNPNKYYVGSAVNFKKRWKEHKIDLKNNNNRECQYLQKVYNKYGINTFKFYILEYVKDLSKLLDREDYYLQDFFWFDVELYNSCYVAGSRLFCKVSKETRKKLSVSSLGRKYPNRKPISDETRKKMSLSHLDKNNKPRSKEWNEKNKEGQKSKPFIIGKRKYRFLSDASKDLNIKRDNIWYRLQSKYYPEYQYI